MRYEEPEMEIVNFEKKQDVVTGSTIDNRPDKGGETDFIW